MNKLWKKIKWSIIYLVLSKTERIALCSLIKDGFDYAIDHYGQSMG